MTARSGRPPGNDVVRDEGTSRREQRANAWCRMSSRRTSSDHSSRPRRSRRSRQSRRPYGTNLPGGLSISIVEVVLALAALALVATGCGGTQIEDDPDGAGMGTSGEEASGGSAETPSSGALALAARPPSDPWVVDIAFDEDGGVIIALADGSLHALNPSTVEVTPLAELDPSEQLTLVHGGDLALGMGGEVPRVVGTKKGTELLRLPEWDAADHISISPSGEHMLVAQDARIGWWNLPAQAEAATEGERVQDFINRQQAEAVLTLPGPVTSFDVGNNGFWVAAANAGNSKGLLQVWNPEEPTTLSSVGRTNKQVVEIALSPSMGHLAAVNEDKSVVVSPTVKGKGFAPWAQSLEAEHVSWTDAGRLLVHGADGSLKALDIASGEAAWTADVPSDQPLRECLSRGIKLACTDGRSVYLMRADTGEWVAWFTTWEGQHLVALETGEHVGNFPAKAVSWSNGEAVDAEAWQTLKADDKVKAVLAEW